MAAPLLPQGHWDEWPLGLLFSIFGCYPDSENENDKVEGQVTSLNGESGIERVAEAQKWLDISAYLKMAWCRSGSCSLLIFSEMERNLNWCALLPSQLTSIGSRHKCLLLFLWLQCVLLFFGNLAWVIGLPYMAVQIVQKSRWYHSDCMRWFDKSSLSNLSTSLPLDSHYSHSLTNI